MRSVFVLLAMAALLTQGLVRAEDDDGGENKDDDDTSGTAAGGGDNADTGGDADGSTTTEATGVEDEEKNDCGSIVDEEECKGSNAGCTWDATGLSCNAPDCGNIDDKDECKAQDGCKYTIAGCQDADGDGGSSEDEDSSKGTCADYDAWQVRCTGYEAKAACQEDKSCLWGQGSCAKDIDYDPNDCGQYKTDLKCEELGAPGAKDVVAPGCFWDNSTDVHVCSVVEEDGDGRSVCEGLEKNPCDNAKSKNEAGDDEKLCEWEVFQEGVGDDIQCQEFEKEGECEAAKDETNHKACEWTEEDGGDTGGGDGNSVEVVNCNFYDVCPTLKDEDACDERSDACTWDKNECKSNSQDGATGGCSSEETEDECEAVKADEVKGGEGVAESDDEGNPVCLWRSFKANSCTYENECSDVESEGDCTDATCKWNEAFKSCVAKVDETECTTESKQKCEAAGCKWEGNKNQDICIDWRECAYMTEDACDGASEKCYWNENVPATCYPGDKPTTSTTVSRTFTTETTSTVTTLFSCGRSDEKMCKEGFATGAAAGRFGDKRCIKRTFFCDGDTDCKDGSDEEGCDFTTDGPKGPKECPMRFKLCNNGKVCYANDWDCDGEDDCGDGTDETNCPQTKKPVKKTTTQTTTTMSETTTTTTKTFTKTTTTVSPCITKGQCDSGFRFVDAGKDTPLFTTPMLCRICATSKTKEQLCAEARTMDCPASELDQAKLVGDKLNSFQNTNLRIKVPSGTNVLDVAAAIKDQLADIDTDIRGSSIVAVDVEEADRTGYSKVVVFSTKASGASSAIANLPAEMEIDVAGERIELFNVASADAPKQDKDGKKLPTFEVDDDFSFEANDDIFKGKSAEEIEALYEQLKAETDLSKFAGDNNAANDESSGGGGVAGAVIGGLIFIGLAIGTVYFLLERKKAAGGGTINRSKYESAPAGGGGQRPGNKASFNANTRTLTLADSGDAGGC